MAPLTRTAETGRAYTREALLAEGFSPRALKYYREIGLLPLASGNGRYAYYTEVHIDILRRIRRARDDRRSLADIKDLLDLGGEP